MRRLWFVAPHQNQIFWVMDCLCYNNHFLLRFNCFRLNANVLAYVFDTRMCVHKLQNLAWVRRLKGTNIDGHCRADL